LGRTHSGFLSDHQFRSGEILPTHFTVDLGISLRHTSADSDGGITRAQFSRAEGAHFPQGDPSRDQIHQLRSDSHQDCEAEQGIVWDNFQAFREV
jgi:hypothetical protein